MKNNITPTGDLDGGGLPPPRFRFCQVENKTPHQTAKGQRNSLTNIKQEIFMSDFT